MVCLNVQDICKRLSEKHAHVVRDATYGFASGSFLNIGTVCRKRAGSIRAECVCSRRCWTSAKVSVSARWLQFKFSLKGSGAISSNLLSRVGCLMVAKDVFKCQDLPKIQVCTKISFSTNSLQLRKNPRIEKRQIIIINMNSLRYCKKQDYINA